ncbi:MAG: cytochrome C [Castellaniella sp.]|uniref:c-type cytochrome n=1 Tax=Castellaniella sp. TaxID=1955812 RepID=UPI002A369327|nr:c-type cytochrome [Castellaniella sp.]MDY0308948.1 cytochrome C [Castellaniella sp.]
MKLSALALSLSLLALGQVAHAAPDYAQVQDILTKNACLACHSVDKKIVGPAYVEVVAKHQGQADAAAVLAKHIKEGSTGVYGPIPMPPNVGITDADLKTVVDWLVAGAPH